MFLANCAKCGNLYTLPTHILSLEAIAGNLRKFGLCLGCWALESTDVPKVSPDEVSTGIQSLKSIDDIDTRREVLICLEKLGIIGRIQFLAWCVLMTQQRTLVTLAPDGSGTFPMIQQVAGTPYECFMDLCSLVAQYGLPLKTVLSELESRASKSKLIVPS